MPIFAYRLLTGDALDFCSVRAVYLKPPELKTTAGYGIILDFETEMQVRGPVPSSRAWCKGRKLCSCELTQWLGFVVQRTEEAGRNLGHSAALVYRHRTLGRVAVTGDLEGTIRFHARNGSLVRVRGNLPHVSWK